MRNLPPETPRPPRDKRSGSALVLAALFCLVLIPMLGLAIDGTNVYMMRSQIANALDAAVLAGNRSLGLGNDIASQTASAQTVAQNTFNADISGMSANMTMSSLLFNVSQDPTTKIITVTGSATASLPLMLMGMVGFTTTTVNVSATSQRRSVNIMLVLDHSKPMTGAPLLALQADAITFLNMFVNDTDNIGLVTFTAAPYVADPLPNLNFQSNVPNDINSMAAPNYSGVNTAAAMSVAYQQLQNVNQPGALNVIVLFTEGLAGSFTGNFAGLVTKPTPCSPAASPLNGAIWTSQDQNPLYRQKYGLADPTSLAVTDNPELRGAPGCTADSSTPWLFLSAMPAFDVYGNSTNGTGSLPAYNTNPPVNLTLTSNSTNDAWNITYAGENALDDAANQIRGNAALPATIFVIGLGGNPGYSSPDPVLMARIANDPTSLDPAPNSANQPSGQYIYAPTTAQLQSAFTSIASQVLKLAAQ